MANTSHRSYSPMCAAGIDWPFHIRTSRRQLMCKVLATALAAVVGLALPAVAEDDQAAPADDTVTLHSGSLAVTIEPRLGGRISDLRFGDRRDIIHNAFGAGLVRIAVGKWESQWNMLDRAPYDAKMNHGAVVLTMTDEQRGFAIEKTIRLISDHEVEVTASIRNTGAARPLTQVGISSQLNAGFRRPYRPLVLCAPVRAGIKRDAIYTSAERRAIFYAATELTDTQVEAYNPTANLTLRLVADGASDLVTQGIGGSYVPHQTFATLAGIWTLPEWKANETRSFRTVLRITDGASSDAVRAVANRKPPVADWSALPRRCAPKITGTFVQLAGARELWCNPVEAARQLDRMHELGIDTLIVDSFSSGKAFYPSKILEPYWEDADPIATILDYADTHAMHVYLSTGYPEGSWESMPADAISTLIDKHGKLMDEMWARYGKHKSAAGWYLAYEINDLQFDDQAYADRLVKLCHGVTDQARRVCPGKPVVAAPYWTMTLQPEEFGKLWESVIKRVGIDVFAMQDTVGADTGEYRLETLAPYYAALRAACERAGARFWTDMEVFERTHGWPTDELPTSFDCADPARIRKQIDVESHYVEKILCFEFTFYMSPASPAEGLREGAIKGYEEYRKYVQGLQKTAVQVTKKGSAKVKTR